MQEGEGDQTEVFEYEIPQPMLTERTVISSDLPTISEARLSCLEETPVKLNGPKPSNLKMTPLSTRNSTQKKSKRQPARVEFFECESEDEVDLFSDQNDGRMNYESV